MVKNIIKKTVALLLVLLVVMAINVSAEESWWSGAYKNMSGLGYINGDEYGNFNPDKPITRAEMAAIIARITRVYGQYPDFTDVASDAWYRNDVRNVAFAGFFDGYDGGKFNPDGYITRAEAAAVISRVFPGRGDGKSPFSDSVPAWAEPYVSAVAAGGIMTGYDDGTFRPQNNITRAEVAVMLDNVIKNIHLYDTDIKDKTYEGNLVIVWDNLTAKNITVNGTLYITGAIDEDEIVLDNVKAKKIVINGTDAVVQLRNTVADEVLVAGRGRAQIIFSRATEVGEVICIADAKLMKHGFDGNIGNVTVDDGAEVESF